MFPHLVVVIVVLRASRGNLHGCVVHEEGNNETEETKGFSENEHKNHGNEDLFLLGVGADGGVTDDTNSKTGGEGGETGGEASTEVEVAREGSVTIVVSVDVVVDDDGDDEAVDTEDTSHDDGDDTSHDTVGGVDTEVGETDAGLGGTVGGAEVGEDEGGGAAHSTEEGGGLGVLVSAGRLALGNSDTSSGGEESNNGSLGNVHFVCNLLLTKYFVWVFLVIKKKKKAAK